MSLHGITVQLTVRTQTGVDPLGAPIYTETEEPVENVLVAPSSSEDVLDTMNLYGKRAVLTLGIPKGDAHVWQDTTVRIWGELYRTIGFPIGGIDDLIPLGWNKKVKVERYGV